MSYGEKKDEEEQKAESKQEAKPGESDTGAAGPDVGLK